MSKQIFELEASVRTDMGKGASRRLRRLNGLVPAIVYGAKKDAMPVTLEQHKVFKALENEAFYSHLLTLKVDGKPEQVVLRALQRHPYKPQIQHMDFQRVSATEKLTMHVPLHFLNADTNAAVVNEGAIVSHHITDVEIRCLPKDLPEFISVDVGSMALNDVLHLSNLNLPQGIELVDLSHGHHNDRAVVSVHMPKIVIEEEPSIEDAAVGEEAAAAPTNDGEAVAADADKKSKKE